MKQYRLFISLVMDGQQSVCTVIQAGPMLQRGRSTVNGLALWWRTCL